MPEAVTEVWLPGDRGSGGTGGTTGAGVRARRAWLPLLAFLALCSLSTVLAWVHAYQRGEDLSEVDAYSESNAVREVRNFLDRGITADYGLGRPLYPGLYPEQGFASNATDRAASLTPSGVYTHYPPGPEYLLYAATLVFGPDSLVRLRLLPIALCGAATVFFGLALRRRFGSPVAWLVMLASASLPSFSDTNDFLHYDGYALALVLVEIGLVMGARAAFVPMALIGFAQGWLSFDYCFLITTIPLAYEIAIPKLSPGTQPRLPVAFWRCVAIGTGFTLAHSLHLLQVWAFFGSLRDALADLGGAAVHRSGADTMPSMLVRGTLTVALAWHYFVGQFPFGLLFSGPGEAVPTFRFLGIELGAWWLLLTVAAFSSRWLVVSLCGVVPSVLWFVVMYQHGFIHRMFIYRHLYFCFFLWALFVAVTLERQGKLGSAQTR